MTQGKVQAEITGPASSLLTNHIELLVPTLKPHLNQPLSQPVEDQVLTGENLVLKCQEELCGLVT